MTAKEEFDRQAAKINVRKTNEATVINAAIAETRSDFAQYNGLSLDSPYSTLIVDTASYNGTTNNAITISLDNGSTVFTTVTAHADDIPYVPPRLYYRARYKVYDGTMDGDDTDTGYVVGSSAYDIMTALGIQGIVA